MECNSSVLQRMDLSYWKSVEKRQELPVTQATVEKVLRLAEANVLEQNRREHRNIEKGKTFNNPKH